MYIQILNPCNENWGQMTPTEKGRFCEACQKQVIDFSVLTDIEIVETLLRNPYACGRFHKKQLNKEYPYPVPPRIAVYSPVSKWTKRFLAAAMLFSTTAPIFAQNFKVQGTIREKSTKQPVPFATAVLFEVQEDGSLVEITKMNTDQKAKYSFYLEDGKNYKVVGNAEGYLANETKLTTEFLGRISISDSMIFEKNIDIKLEEERHVMGRNSANYVYFEEGKYNLTQEARKSLDDLISVLTKNPNITIAIGAHSDINEAGKNTYKLSEMRAMAAIKYCVDNCIEPERLSWHSFGDSFPIFSPIKNPEESQVNRRIEFRITSIDYQKK